MKKEKKTRKRWMLFALGIFVAVVLLLAAQPAWLWRLTMRSFPGVVWRVETREPVIALTFDDGPDLVYTPQVLEILARHNVRATFFLVGAHARQYPEMVTRIRAAGHEVGNHTDSMATTLYMSSEKFEASLLKAEATLSLPGPRKLLRPAGGLIRPAQVTVAKRHGYTVVLLSAYAFDGHRPPATYIRWATVKNLRPGVIVCLHSAGGNQSNTVAALEGILAAAEEKGLYAVTLSELLDASTPAAK